VHIPDGMISAEVAVGSGVLAAGAIAYAAGRVRDPESRARCALAAPAAGLVFALQLVNFPVEHATSGHLLGGVLAAMLLGPWLAILSVTGVLAVQALLFADGGLGALGANVLVMAVIGPVIVAALGSRWPRSAVLPVAIVAWTSTVIAAAVVAVLLGVSGTADFGSALAALVEVHALIGVGEALLTVVVLSLVRMADQPVRAVTRRSRPVALVLLALAVAAFAAPVASSAPDGLERVAIDQGFDERSERRSAPIADYAVPGVADPSLSTALAGIVGTVALALGGGWSLRRAALAGPVRPRSRTIA